MRTPGRARSIEVAARFTHLRALNGVTDQHPHGSDDPYHRSRCGSGPKAVGPRLRVTENFRPIDHCRLHQDTRWTDFIGALLQRLGGSVAPQKVERPHYGIVSCQEKRITTVASARPRAGGGRGRRNPLAGDPHWLYCAGNSARPLWSPGRDRHLSVANTTVKTPPSIDVNGRIG